MIDKVKNKKEKTNAWHIKNYERKRATQKRYYERHKEEINAKYTCSCGATISKVYKTKHELTIVHIENLNKGIKPPQAVFSNIKLN